MAKKKKFAELFQGFADWVSDAMGRPFNIVAWFVLITTWTLVFATHLVNPAGTFLPAWFTSQGFNFPLNLVTTVAELFIGFLVATAANRAQNALTVLLNRMSAVEDHISSETDEIDAVLKKMDTLLQENTDLTREIHSNSLLLEEIHKHVTTLTPTAGTFSPKD